jgi:hypothetical protein
MGYPRTWHLTRFRGVCKVGFSGAMVSNVSGAYHSPVSPNGCYWPPDMASLPSDGVVVEFDLMKGGLGPVTSLAPDTTFPLSLASLQAAPTPGTDVRWFHQPVQLKGNPRYQLNVWIGAGATQQDRC